MEYNAIKVNQWLTTWDTLDYDPAQMRSKPSPYFYMFSMPATILRRYSGVQRRPGNADDRDAVEKRIQRAHDESRSGEIRRFVEGGYPWSALSPGKRASGAFDHLRKPGWLPTAIVVNILTPGSERRGITLSVDESVVVEDQSGTDLGRIVLPDVPGEDALHPIEIIDGQHRLYAFEGDEDDAQIETFSLPVIAFVGLDISWQAYLFWTINIKPKKINPSLAFDLYPLLREQDWLTSGEEIPAYKESRAQELTELLWSSIESPWYRRINMVGGSRKEYGSVTQASFIRSLIAALVKSWSPTNVQIGGLFGGASVAGEALGWNRLQQGALLIQSWRELAEAVEVANEPWIDALRTESSVDRLSESQANIGFLSSASLLSHDQGVRAFHHVLNDLMYVSCERLKLRSWRMADDLDVPNKDLLQFALSELESLPVRHYLTSVCSSLAVFDWRSSASTTLTEAERASKASFRGSGGYRALRSTVMQHLAEVGDPVVSEDARRVIGELEL